MHLTIREEERLQIWTLAEMGRRRLAKGVKLNYPEAAALICDEIMERVCEGCIPMLVDMMDYGATILKTHHVMDGVPEMMKILQVEAVFEDGTKLVTVMNPIREAEGEKLPWAPPPIPRSVVPDESFDVGDPLPPGTIEFGEGDIEINAGRETIELVLTNTGDRPIQIGAHYHLVEANRAMAFDREAAFGFRLDIPSGTALRFEPGQSRKCQLTRFAGAQVSMGMNDMTNGSMRSEETKRLTMKKLREHGYCFEGERASNKPRADTANAVPPAKP